MDIVKLNTKQLYKIMSIVFKVIYDYDLFGNRKPLNLVDIKRDLKIENKFFTYDQYLHDFIDHIKDNILRKFSSLYDVDFQVNIYSETNAFHNFVKQTIILLLKLIGPLPSEFNFHINKINWKKLVIVEIYNKSVIPNKLEFVGILNGEPLVA